MIDTCKANVFAEEKKIQIQANDFNGNWCPTGQVSIFITKDMYLVSQWKDTLKVVQYVPMNSRLKDTF